MINLRFPSSIYFKQHTRQHRIIFQGFLTSTRRTPSIDIFFFFFFSSPQIKKNQFKQIIFSCFWIIPDKTIFASLLYSLQYSQKCSGSTIFFRNRVLKKKSVTISFFFCSVHSASMKSSSCVDYSFVLFRYFRGWIFWNCYKKLGRVVNDWQVGNNIETT